MEAVRQGGQARRHPDHQVPPTQEGVERYRVTNVRDAHVAGVPYLPQTYSRLYRAAGRRCLCNVADWPESCETGVMVGRRGVFVAYSFADGDALRVVDEVLSGFPDWSRVRLGMLAEWKPLADKAIEGCELFVFLDSYSARASQNCKYEMGVARAIGLVVHVLKVADAAAIGDLLEDVRQTR